MFYHTAWLLHNKILRAMAHREESYLLRGKFQIDDSYLRGELAGGKAGRGSENKIPIVAAVSLDEAGHLIYARITAVSGFSSEAIADWAKHHLAPGSQVLSDGLACFRSVTTAGCSYEAIVTGGKNPSDLPQFCWIITLLGNLKTSFNGTFHSFNFDKPRCVAAISQPVLDHLRSFAATVLYSDKEVGAKLLEVEEKGRFACSASAFTSKSLRSTRSNSWRKAAISPPASVA